MTNPDMNMPELKPCHCGSEHITFHVIDNYDFWFVGAASCNQCGELQAFSCRTAPEIQEAATRAWNLKRSESKHKADMQALREKVEGLDRRFHDIDGMFVSKVGKFIMLDDVLSLIDEMRGER